MKNSFFVFIALFSTVLLFASFALSDSKGDGLVNSSGFIQSLVIIVREGFEAILIVGAISAYLVVSKNQDKLKTVYLGVAIAIIASLVTAFLIEQIFFFGESQMKLLEGVTLIIAAVVLLFVTNWMLAKAEALKWHKYIKGKVDNAVTAGSSFSLGLVSFFAVYREGFETVLFYKALFLQTNNSADIFFGFIVGIIILTIVFVGIQKLGVKVPINIFFLSTSVLLFFFAFSFIGFGVHELQEASIIGETDFDLVPKIKIIGLYPTIETLLAQFLVLVFGAFMAYIHIFKHQDLQK